MFFWQTVKKKEQNQEPYFLQTLKWQKNAIYDSVFVSDMKPRKSFTVPFLVLFRTGIRVRKLDLFFANFKKLLKTRIFLANSKMLKTVWFQEKLLWFRFCIR